MVVQSDKYSSYTLVIDSFHFANAEEWTGCLNSLPMVQNGIPRVRLFISGTWGTSDDERIRGLVGKPVDERSEYQGLSPPFQRRLWHRRYHWVFDKEFLDLIDFKGMHRRRDVIPDALVDTNH